MALTGAMTGLGWAGCIIKFNYHLKLCRPKQRFSYIIVNCHSDNYHSIDKAGGREGNQNCAAVSVRVSNGNGM